MDPPIVYIEKEPFLNMILAAIETGKRECYGYILGYKPTKKRNSFIITSTSDVQLAKKRINKEVEQSRASKKRMKACFLKYPSLYPVLGDFHSHPDWGEYTREPGPSRSDIRSTHRDGHTIGIVIKMVSLKKERYMWERIPSGGFIGSLGKYKFYFNVYRIVRDERDKLQEEYLTIQAPAAIKALNRALGYK